MISVSTWAHTATTEHNDWLLKKIPKSTAVPRRELLEKFKFLLKRIGYWGIPLWLLIIELRNVPPLVAF